MSRRLIPQTQKDTPEDGICELHKKPLQLFCAQDYVMLCVMCFRYQDHTGHVVCEVEDAAQYCRKLFLGILETLKEKLEVAKIILAEEQQRMVMVQGEEQNFREMIESEHRILFQLIIKINEKNIKNHKGSINWREFGLIQLSEFAKEVAKSYKTIQRLNKLSRENMMKLQESEAKLGEQICNLQKISTELEWKCGQSIFVLLQNAGYYLERGESILHQCLEPACITELSLCHVSGMSKILKCFQRPITLDPKTVHPCLVLSEDLRSVRFRAAQQGTPANPRKFDFSATVLGMEGFTSGWHYWEVEVGKADTWQLGICINAHTRADRPDASECKILLTRSIMGNHCTFWVAPPLKRVSLREHMGIVGVFLYYEYGQLSFYDVTEGHLIYSFSNLVFRGTVRPIFSLCVLNGCSTSDSLRICPPPVSAGAVPVTQPLFLM